MRVYARSSVDANDAADLIAAEAKSPDVAGAVPVS